VSRQRSFNPDNLEGAELVQSVTMSSPDLTKAEREAVAAVLSTPVLSFGPQIKNFEKSVAEYVGSKYAVGVNSGTSGLHLSVIASNVQEGDLVITTPFSFIASANCILYERAIPVFVDVDPLTACIDPALVAQCVRDLTSGDVEASRWLPKTMRDSRPRGRLKMILPVHAFGQPADMDPIIGAAAAHKLAIVEDACEAIGAEYKGRRAGSMSDAAVFAFYPNKQVTTGEGGMVVTNSEEFDVLFRSLRNQGRDVFDGWLNHSRLGYNYRMDEMSAALGVTQMQRIDELLSRRSQVAQWYTQRLSGKELIQIPFIHDNTTRMSWFVYVVQIKHPASRDTVINTLADRGVPSRPYFTPIHLQPFYAQRFGYRKGDFPVTENLSDVVLALPFSGVITESQVDFVCRELESAVAKSAARVQQ
jgi:perosamine synthetase